MHLERRAFPPETLSLVILRHYSRIVAFVMELYRDYILLDARYIYLYLCFNIRCSCVVRRV